MKYPVVLFDPSKLQCPFCWSALRAKKTSSKKFDHYICHHCKTEIKKPKERWEKARDPTSTKQYEI